MKNLIKVLIENNFGMQTLEFIKLLKEGRVEFYKGLRNKNKKKAVKFLRKLKNRGFFRYQIYYNDYGYIIKNS